MEAFLFFNSLVFLRVYRTRIKILIDILRLMFYVAVNTRPFFLLGGPNVPSIETRPRVIITLRAKSDFCHSRLFITCEQSKL